MLEASPHDGVAFLSCFLYILRSNSPNTPRKKDYSWQEETGENARVFGTATEAQWIKRNTLLSVHLEITSSGRLLWTRFRFRNGAGQSIPQQLFQEPGSFSPVSSPLLPSPIVRPTRCFRILKEGRQQMEKEYTRKHEYAPSFHTIKAGGSGLYDRL